MNSHLAWVVLVISALGCSFSAACHAALKTFSRKRLVDLLEARGKGHRAERLAERQPAMLLGTGLWRAFFTMTMVFALIAVCEQWSGIWEPSGIYLLAFALACVFSSLFAVAIPVSWARYRRERLLARALPLVTLLTRLSWPVRAPLALVDPVVRRVSGADLPGQEESSDISEEVLSVVEDHDQGDAVDETQRDMLEAVFELPNITAGEIMTPRTDIDGIEIQRSLEEVVATVQGYGHSRIPVYEESLDHIVGLLYAKDLIRFIGNGQAFDLRALLRETYLVPESKSVQELLAEFKARKVHFAVVLDEYGGTAGIVTIEDILEQIVGDIQDEYEEVEETPLFHQIDAYTADVEARIYIDDLNDKFDLNLPEDEDYDTLGGFVTSVLGHIPGEGESLDHQSLRLTVTQAERTKVLRVRIEKQAPQLPPGAAPQEDAA